MELRKDEEEVRGFGGRNLVHNEKLTHQFMLTGRRVYFELGERVIK